MEELKEGKNIESVENKPPVNLDRGGFAWGFLGFFIPIVGFILWLVWRDEKPKTAKSLGIGALVGVIIGFIFIVIYFLIMMFVLGMAITNG
ncbi:hypothetical protein [Fusobacterium ulcerans]|jgi:hypothetical protein|uniref:DUF4190 domain-containing protein n=2 Tax=Fusobacterium ulcerans TaxID=861 RepID=A0AAX1TPT6_9FUSO|nr:hypothetical protein [Fusobacterium ulcerans]AVQ29327.1 hypothetical protein C4N20_14915 [Fusobacterium ulcerans]EFS27258.1 hypothetical protein FUAG_02773 [Fusobacterium ulcerans ATCC 49185]EHO81251.1 hypothetical protein HMPREF0402_01676 [Fusobacterium ulcerans 12-1B]RGY62694.1 hypothetical protein DXA30_11810 [Fusobacterium ulcerans]SQJ02739.1 Uncharacterised protein [Fusobacterium ulcerans]